MWKTIEQVPLYDDVPKDTYVLAARYDGKVREARFSSRHNLWIERNGNPWGTTAATHWMPIPKPPKED